MKAYVELIQRKEREIGCDVLTHQKVPHFLDVSYCETDDTVVRSRLRRFNDDDRYGRNVSGISLAEAPVTVRDADLQLFHRRNGRGCDGIAVCR